MQNRNPAKHPGILIGITLLGVFGGIAVGGFDPAYGTAFGLFLRNDWRRLWNVLWNLSCYVMVAHRYLF